ncbi:MAG: hypothetical protein PHW24_00570 [Candidatus Moranbacteria bacterium]|nr:hypothetical protein [Candidatus Moranbacteria bacterium]
MSWENPNISIVERPGEKMKKELNSQIAELLRSGTQLENIVELLDAKDFFEFIGQSKNQSPVAHFDVDGFIKKRTEENRKFSLPEKYEKIDEIILPPDEGEMKFGSGAGFKEKDIIPRSTMLMEILTELNLKYFIIEGINDSGMMRRLSYLSFCIPAINKMVLVNDEEGNATFVVHDVQQEKIREYIKKTKEELSGMSHDKVSSLNYSDKNKDGHEQRWKERIRDILTDVIDKHDESVEIEKKYEKAPDGWLTINGLSNKTGVSIKILDNFLRKYKESNPDEFKIYRHSTKNIPWEHISPELVDIIQRLLNERVDVAPEGWKTASSLSTKSENNIVNASDNTIRVSAAKYKIEHPEWFKIYRDKIGREREHYSPELIEKLVEEFNVLENPPEGWLNAGQLSKSLGITYRSVYEYIEEYKLSNPEYFHVYKDEAGIAREHYSSELVKIINEARAIPGGWLNNFMLTKEVGVSEGKVKKFAENYKTSNPGWFKIFKDINGIERPYYSPELVVILKVELLKPLGDAPSGWVTKSSVKKNFKIDDSTVKKNIEPYRIDHPEWFHVYKDEVGVSREFYSPELIMTMKEDRENEIAPDGWMIANSLSKSTGIYFQTLQKYAEKYRDTNPEWFRKYRHESGMYLEYYSPELIEAIRRYAENNN